MNTITLWSLGQLFPSGTSGGFGGGIVDLILYSGPVVKVVLLILLFFSILSWAIIFSKFRLIRLADGESRSFLRVFWEGKQFASIYAESKKLRHSPTAEIFRAAYEHQKAVDKKDKIIVGVNEFVSGKPVKVKTQKIDPKLESRRRKELAALRKKRSAGKVEKCLATLDKAAKSSENLVPIMIDCVRNYVTLGEICRVLRKEFGEYRATHSI